MFKIAYSYFKPLLIKVLGSPVSLYSGCNILFCIQTKLPEPNLFFYLALFENGMKGDFLMCILWEQQSLQAIVTHLAYRANGKKMRSILQQFTEQKCVALFGAVLGRHPSRRSYLLDVRQRNIVFASYKHKKHACVTVKPLAVFLLCSGGSWKNLKDVTAFLAHLSRRLTRWAYRIGLEPASVCPCIRVCVR